MNVSFEHKVFDFKTPSGTSRGVLTEKHAWFLTISEGDKTGIGECSIIPGLSPDFENEDEYESLLREFSTAIKTINLRDFERYSEFEILEEIKSKTSFFTDLSEYPSLLFGFETALLSWSSKSAAKYFNTPFSRSEARIPINGLVWMGNMAFMCEQMHKKVDQGFDCIKMKVGAIDFAAEVEILEDFRKNHSADDMILRVDANGAFKEADVREKLEILSQFDIHSIEQPIEVGQYDLMAELCKENILPIALDEELIGIITKKEKESLLDKIKPQYIILKPSLHGGILSCKEWIKLAEERNIGWWMTSALESNLGLECIAQFTATYPIDKHHGLGTGSLYVNNLSSGLTVEEGKIFYR